MPDEFKEQIRGWIQGGQANIALSSELAGQFIDGIQDKAQALFQGATHTIGHWFTN